MRTKVGIATVVGTCLLAVSACKSENPNLTQQVFADAVKTCHPLAATVHMYVDSSRPPTVDITVPDSSSPIANCMVGAFHGYRFDRIRITIARSAAKAGTQT